MTTATNAPGAMIRMDGLILSDTNARKHFDADELAALVKSIKARGILAPLVVRVHPAEPDHFEIIAGERRFKAAQKAGLEAVPCRIVEADDATALEIQADENLARVNLNPLEEAATYQTLIDGTGKTQEQIAAKYKRTQSYVANRLRLLNLPKTWQKKLITGEIPLTFARDLAAWVKYPFLISFQQMELRLDILKHNLAPGGELELSDFRGLLADGICDISAPLKDAAPLSLTPELRKELVIKGVPETMFPAGTERVFNVDRLNQLLEETETQEAWTEEIDISSPSQLDQAPLFDPEEMAPDPTAAESIPEKSPAEIAANTTHAQEVADRNKAAAGPAVDYAEYFRECVVQMIAKRLNAREPVFLKQVSRLPQFWNHWKPDEPFLKLFSHAQLIELAREWGLDLKHLEGYTEATPAMIDEILLQTTQKRLEFGEDPFHKIGPPLALIEQGAAVIKEGVQVTA
jgi:ParB/RepB/Spo0J family partition protein